MISHTVSVFSKMLVLFLFEFNSWIIIFSGNSQIDLRFDAAIAFFRRVLNRKRWEKISFVEDWCNCDWKLETFIYLQYLLWVLERFWNDIDIVIKNMTAKSSKIFFSNLIQNAQCGKRANFSLTWKIFREINLHAILFQKVKYSVISIAQYGNGGNLTKLSSNQAKQLTHKLQIISHFFDEK